MVRKRLDERIRTLMERAVITNQRCMLILVGDRAANNQIPNIHQIMTQIQTTTVMQSSSDENGNNHASSSSSSSTMKLNRGRPKILWCYKKELGFSTHKMKRLKKLKRDKSRGLIGNDGSTNAVDNFELFISQNDITWCYYRDSHRILGTTYNMLILQDFEALTPNLLARTIETVSGGGIIVFLLRTVTSLKQLYTVSMDVHSRYRTDNAGDIIPRFNERFILSLGKCTNCLVCDDELNVLPISRKELQKLIPSSKNNNNVQEATAEDIELQELQESLLDTPHVGVLVELTKTLDQAKALLVFLEACSDKTSSTSTNAGSSTNKSTVVAMTAGRGRGKSAAVGLCLAGAISLGYSTITVTAPEAENLVAVFDFIIRGLKALKYQDHIDYNITYNNAKGRENIKCITSISIHRTHRQIIQYIPPTNTDQFLTSEIVAIDEAAAIPLPIVKALLQQSNDRLTFLSSTINGYEGTGRALSLKLIKELRESKGNKQGSAIVEMANEIEIERKSTKKGDVKVHEQRWAAAADIAAGHITSSSGEKLFGPLREIELSTPIRYGLGDPIETWLNKLLCLDCGTDPHALKLHGGAPAPLTCELYYVDRDALFSYHKLSESFLQKIMNLYTSAHYKNTPNDLQMLSDAPAHHVFVLLSPSAEQDAQQQKQNNGDSKKPTLPDVLVVVQVALEGKISRKVVEAQLSRGHRSAGDLIPWTISQQFGDSKFAQLSGARIVRIAVHPSLQGMGYGSRAIELLYRFYNGELMSLNNNNSIETDESGGDDDDDDDRDADDSSNDDDDEDTGNEEGAKKTGIHGEKLKPRKELPPLLLPLEDVKAPKLDWIGTSFGLTLQLHKFWTHSRMKLLYLRQTKNELTGEHSAIMVRALPKRTGVDDAWLASFVCDARRRFVTLLGGSFRDIDIRQSLSVLENMDIPTTTTTLMDNRVGAGVGKLTADELDYYMTPHDMKRLELYGRNLCDHHLITDLIPVVARFYFLGRFDSSGLTLSSVQAALMCGIGLQQRSVDSLTAELGLPANQVLAMFNKAVRKISIALNTVVLEKEKKTLFVSSEERMKGEAMADKMRDVAEKTLDEDVEDAANDAMESLRRQNMVYENDDNYPTSSLPPEISEDQELMQFVVKGSDDQWKKALGDREELDAVGTIQIQSFREKRKAVQEDDTELDGKGDHDKPKKSSKHKQSKGNTDKKKKKKLRR